MSLNDNVNAFAAKGWWQKALVNTAKVGLMALVAGAAVHYLPQETANQVITAVSSFLSVSPTTVQ